MSAFNTVKAKAKCPQCSAVVNVVVQFKYGNTWQHEYNLGDILRWGGNDVGDPKARLVIVDGVAEGACSHCGFNGDWNLYVSVRNGRLEQVETADGSIDFARLGSTYVIQE
jgi:hypothetical protein